MFMASALSSWPSAIGLEGFEESKLSRRSHKPRPGAARAYYLGKALYAKGWRELLDLLKVSDLKELVLDGFGSGR